MSPNDAIAVIKAATDNDPLAGLALGVAAVVRACRAELAALRWSDLDGSVLTIDSAIEPLNPPYGLQWRRNRG
jgi:hypothetical protein